MPRRLVLLSLVCAAFASAVIIDRIAVVIGDGIVKDSDISRNIRVIAFLNGAKLDFSQASRKAATNRLIDQIFIHKEIDLGGYATATYEEAEAQLGKLIGSRYHSDAALQAELGRYGITRADLKEQFKWQLTVLRFIDARFRPAVLVTDDEIQKYYNDHATALRREYPGKSLEQLKPTIQDLVTAEQVNQQFFSWLDQQRKDNQVKYLEEGLA